MNTQCFENLVGVRDLCGSEKKPILYIDDIEGIDSQTLAHLANVDTIIYFRKFGL